MDFWRNFKQIEELYRLPSELKERFKDLSSPKKKELRKSLKANLHDERKSPECKKLSKQLLREILTDDSSESEAEQLNRIYSENDDSMDDTNKAGKLKRFAAKRLTVLFDNVNMDNDETYCSAIAVENKTNVQILSISKINTEESEHMERLQFSFEETSDRNSAEKNVDILSQKVSSMGISSPKKNSPVTLSTDTQIVSLESERRSYDKLDLSTKLPLLKIQRKLQDTISALDLTVSDSLNNSIVTLSSSVSKISDDESDSIAGSDKNDEEEEDEVIVLSDSDNTIDSLNPPKKQSDCSEQVSELRPSGQTFLAPTLSNNKADRLEAFLNDLPAVGEENNSYYDNAKLHDSILVKTTDYSNTSVCVTDPEESVEIPETSTEHEINEKSSSEILETSVENEKENSYEKEISISHSKTSIVYDSPKCRSPKIEDASPDSIDIESAKKENKTRQEQASFIHDSPTIEDDSPLIQATNAKEKKTPQSSGAKKKQDNSKLSDSEYEEISISAKFDIKIQINSNQPNVKFTKNFSSSTKKAKPNARGAKESPKREKHEEKHKASITPKNFIKTQPGKPDKITEKDIARKMLTELYGSQWQTPENIKKLDLTSKLIKQTPKEKFPSEKKKNNSDKTGDDNVLLSKNIKNIKNTDKCFQTPMQMVQKSDKTTKTDKDVHDESVIADFSTFHKNIEADLESTRLNLNNKMKEINEKQTAHFKVPQSATTRSGRPVRPMKWRQLVDSDNSSDGDCSDDSDVNITYHEKINSSSSDSEGSYIAKTRNKTKKLPKRPKPKGKNKKDDEIIYLDLSNDCVKVQDEYKSPAASHDPKFNDRLNSLLNSCTYQPRKQLESTPSQLISKRKLFTPRFGDEEEVLPPDSPLRQFNSNKDNINLAIPLPSIFGMPINKKLESVKTGTPIFKIPTPPRRKEHETPKTKTGNKENDEEPGPNLVLTKTPKNTKTPKTPRTPKSKIDLTEEVIPQHTPANKYGFLKSLDVMVSKSRCHPDALIYRDNYKSRKEELAQRLYKLYNEKLFKNELNVLIIWNKKLNNTAGRCSNKKKGTVRTSVIELSEKALTSADRLRCTLIHELCHAATWIFNGEHGHGATWKSWAQKANFVFQELPKIGVCHSYDIEYKYTYKCTLCQAKSHAHSKSKKVEKIRCAYCHGAIEIFLNKKDKEGNIVATPVKEATGFAKFVKENYKKFQKPDLKHADVMKLLGTEFAALGVGK